MKDIPDADIAQWVPEDSVEIIYWNEVVSDDLRNPALYLSAPFRSALKYCLTEADSQPSGLFDVMEAEVCAKFQGVPKSDTVLQGGTSSVISVGGYMLSCWYDKVRQSLQTPPPTDRTLPQEGNTPSPDQDGSPYNGRVMNVSPFDKELRSGMKYAIADLKL